MNAHETTEIRELTATDGVRELTNDELLAIAGGLAPMAQGKIEAALPGLAVDASTLPTARDLFPWVWWM
jgi:hypothetical protein